MMKTPQLSKKQIVEQAKSHGLFISENHGAIHAAKDLITANKRIIELEAIINSDCTTSNHCKLIKNYYSKWRK